MSTKPEPSNRTATAYAFAALLISIVSFVWPAIAKIFPGSVLAHRVSWQNRDDSTRFSISIENNLPKGVICFPSGDYVHVTGELDSSRPCLTLRRNARDAGSLRCIFPSSGPPILQQIDAAGNVLWSTPAAPPTP